MRSRKRPAESEQADKPEAILRKVKHMQNILKKEGLSNKTMKENIDTFEDVPAYVRRNLSIGLPISLPAANYQSSRFHRAMTMSPSCARTTRI